MLLNSPDDIRKKFAKAVSDSDMLVHYDWDNKPAVSNLIEIYSVFSGDSIETIENVMKVRDTGHLKKILPRLLSKS
ncbi:hypothetical protein [Paenibacillus prosopidis]|uniref:hypothetical protein n=1 Tax=Paenibacillus prosopidis TaxID=630520 RepID=UPI001FEC896A|nr:hypothetical protein [Paenibacillus prosopidis]